MPDRRVAFHFSGGKDSTLALSMLLARADLVVDRLLTTVHSARGASTVHGIPVELLQAQARSIGLPLQLVDVPGPGLDGYAEAMDAACELIRADGVDAVGFGDLGCSGVLELKQRQFGRFGLDVLEPLWDLSSDECVHRFVRSGLRAVTVVIDAAALDRSFLGVDVDASFVGRLPDGVDPCGEFGEYHSFAYDGPIFAEPVPFALSEPRHLTREIGTSDGVRHYEYWLATPRPPAG